MLPWLRSLSFAGGDEHAAWSTANLIHQGSLGNSLPTAALGSEPALRVGNVGKHPGHCGQGSATHTRVSSSQQCTPLALLCPGQSLPQAGGAVPSPAPTSSCCSGGACSCLPALLLHSTSGDFPPACLVHHASLLPCWTLPHASTCLLPPAAVPLTERELGVRGHSEIQVCLGHHYP